MDSPTSLSIKIFLLLLIMATGYSGCSPEKSSTPVEKTDIHTSQNSLDVTGTYTGILPCASCVGIETNLTLTDSTYQLSMIYLGGQEPNEFQKTGNYSWTKAGNTITLENKEAPNQYFVGENMLIHLDQNGDRIIGDLANKYRLEKQP